MSVKSPGIILPFSSIPFGITFGSKYSFGWLNISHITGPVNSNVFRIPDSISELFFMLTYFISNPFAILLKFGNDTPDSFPDP